MLHALQSLCFSRYQKELGKSWFLTLSLKVNIQQRKLLLQKELALETLKLSNMEEFLLYFRHELAAEVMDVTFSWRND